MIIAPVFFNPMYIISRIAPTHENIFAWKKSEWLIDCSNMTLLSYREGLSKKTQGVENSLKKS